MHVPVELAHHAKRLSWHYYLWIERKRRLHVECKISIKANKYSQRCDISQTKSITHRTHRFSSNVTLLWIISSRPNAAIWYQVTWSALFHAMACRLFRAKPLSQRQYQSISNWTFNIKHDIYIQLQKFSPKYKHLKPQWVNLTSLNSHDAM